MLLAQAGEEEGRSLQQRRGSLRAIGAEVARVAGPVLGKRGFGEAHLIAQWDSVMGEDLAAQISPDRLSFARGERREGTLHLRVAPGFALEAQHREPLLIERINAFFGYRAVARIRLIQGPPARPAAPKPPKPRALVASEQQELDRKLADIEDPGLREALRALGAAVIGSSRR